MKNEDAKKQHKKTLTADDSLTIPVMHEEAEVGKKVVETGKVRIAKSVREEEETIDVPLVHEEVQVKRVSINRYLDNGSPQVRYEGETMIIPVIKEVVVVEKRLMLVEEIHVTRHQVETHHKQQVNLLREEVNVERARDPDQHI